MQSCLLLSKGIENFVGFCQFLKTNYFLLLQNKECTSFCEKENTALFPNVPSNLVLLQSKNKQAEAEYRYWHQDFTIFTEGFKGWELHISNDKKADIYIYLYPYLVA